MANPPLKRIALWLLVLLAAAGMWVYVLKIWSAGQFAQFSDLYAPWWASHELLLHHRDPYTVEVAHEIQTYIYGAPSAARFPGDPQEIAGGFAYPTHAAFFLTPLLWLSFPQAQALAGWLFGGLVVAGVLLWCSSFDWPLRFPSQVMLMAGVLATFPVAQAIKLRNLSALGAVLIAGFLLALIRHRYVLGGVLLAAATFKPQFVILLVPWILLWTLGEWRRRRWLLFGFAGTMALLIGASELLVSDSTLKFLRITRAYRQYTPGRSLVDLWFPQPWNWVMAGLLIAGAAVLCFRHQRIKVDDKRFAWLYAWLLSLTLVIVPTLAPHAQLLLIPGYLLILRDAKAIWQMGKWPRLMFVLACVLPLWESSAALGLSTALLWKPLAGVHDSWLLVLYPSALMPLGLILMLGYLLLQETRLAQHA